ncbi:hypothetical protein BDZ97DRAFT_1797433 [Flammula alnicola]|nr:hypothetical protein BDZ97DRAFT_1797433 [Flammula alnicola]
MLLALKPALMKAPAASADASPNSPLDICPVIASGDADFAALLYAAIDREDECNENLPGAKLITSAMKDAWPVKKARFNDPMPALDATDNSPLNSSHQQSCQHKKRHHAHNKQILVNGYPPSVKTAQKCLSSAEIVQTVLDTTKLPVASGARTALNKPIPQNRREIPEIKALVDDGFQYVACGMDGVLSKAPQPIVNRNRLIIGHIAGAPQDSTYDKEAKDLFKVIIEESDPNTFSKDELNHKRGNFPAINFGFTLPNGFKHPINLENSHHKEKIRCISGCPGFSRVTAFQNAAFEFWNPGIYRYQKSCIEQLLAHDPELKCTTPKTIFPTTACNFRNVCCYKHHDMQNCPFGWCAITALGDFDHTLGGHLVLWELKLDIEFPHGYTVFIPSATITHSNIPVVDGDVRVSITQYCTGSIFCYVDNGFRTDRALHEEDKKRYEKSQAQKDHMWRMSLGLLSTVQDLKIGKHPAVPLFQ